MPSQVEEIANQALKKELIILITRLSPGTGIIQWFFSVKSDLIVRLTEALKPILASVESSTTLRQTFEIAANLEKTLSGFINQELSLLDTLAPFEDLRPQLSLFNQVSTAIKGINYHLTKHVLTLLQVARANDYSESYWLELQALSTHLMPNLSLFPALNKTDAASEHMKQVMDFTLAMVLVCLLKEVDEPHGQQFVQELALSLRGKPIHLQPAFTSIHEECMYVQAYCAHHEPIGAFAHVSDSGTMRDTPLHQRAHLGVSHAEGSESSILIPVYMSETELDNISEFMTSADPKQIVSQVMKGSIALDKNGLCYLPFQLEFFHELIHVLHNAKGMNLRYVPLSKDEKDWTSYEEYHTIRGAELCEATFAGAYGARARVSHQALDANILFEIKSSPSVTIIDLMRAHGASSDHQGPAISP